MLQHLLSLIHIYYINVYLWLGGLLDEIKPRKNKGRYNGLNGGQDD